MAAIAPVRSVLARLCTATVSNVRTQLRCFSGGVGLTPTSAAAGAGAGSPAPSPPPLVPTEPLKLNTISDNPGARKKKKRVGRGIGSGRGKTCGRGHKVSIIHSLSLLSPSSVKTFSIFFGQQY